jgi:hypothetical protein
MSRTRAARSSDASIGATGIRSGRGSGNGPLDAPAAR